MKDLLILLGIALALVVVFIGAINYSSRTQTTTTSISLEVTSANAEIEELPFLGTMPALEGIEAWINSEPLGPEDFEGKVVLIDFMTYTCINCIRTFPYVGSWWEKYEDDGLLIIGVHTPEFEFEKIYDNVVEAAEKYGLNYPIAQDNDYVTWRNFNNRFWPAEYLFDKEGNLRYTHFGEGKYDETEAAIQYLLQVEDEMTTGEVPNYAGIKSPETYFGWWRDENFASVEGVQESTVTSYTLPEELDLNEWALEGSWTVQRQHAEALEAGARFQFRYSSSVANIVMATADGTLQDVVIYLDGKPVPEDMLGAHVVIDELTGQTFTQIEFSDLYELIAGEPGEHLLELETLEPGLQIFAITFG